MEISGHIVDVLDKRIYDGTIAVENGRISGIASAKVSKDAPYILPGFVDAHLHIESTLLTPENYAGAAVSKGVLAVVSDPHEIANVSGLEGIRFMIENGKKVNFHFNFCAPSCVPCTPFETSGASIDHSDIESLLESEDICALAEFMNAFGVISGDKECLAKLEAAKRAGKPIDGHAPGLSGDALLKYAAAGISTDHECVSLEEALERLKAGMKVIIREGSASCDFEKLSPLLADYPDDLMFCSDDKYPDELMEGYINRMVSLSVAKGYPLWNILNAACVNPVKHYGLKHGLLKQGHGADFIIVDNLKDFNVLYTYINGEQVYTSNSGGYSNECSRGSSSDSCGMSSSLSSSGKSCKAASEPQLSDHVRSAADGAYPNAFRAEKISEKNIQVLLDEKDYEGNTDVQIRIITAEDLSIRTGSIYVKPKVDEGRIVPDIENDILKIVVYSRYGNGRPQCAFIHGFGMKEGAIASTIAHDSHNIVALGTNDHDIVAGINRLIELKGGMIVCAGTETFELPLPVGGLMSDLDCKTASKKYKILKEQVRRLGCRFNAAFMTLSFMCLPVIPDLKLTDKGLFDAQSFTFTGLKKNL